jgi:rubrerythrin
MEHRGEQASAAVFREMCEIEKRHVDLVSDWATSLQQRLPPASDFTWRLPPEIAESWDEVQSSSLLTPYRALAIAVTNEERAFALYSYIAAMADDRGVAQLAETLAREELTHATELRVRRRQAYRRELPGKSLPAPDTVETLADLRAVELRLAREIAEAHRAIARSLEAAGDPESAGMLSALAHREAKIASFAGTAKAAASARRGLPAGRQLTDLLQAALRPLEAASEIYEDIIAHADHEDLMNAAQEALQRVVEGISIVGRRLGELQAADDRAQRR